MSPVNLTEDVVFVDRMMTVVKSSGLMGRPVFDRAACRFVEGPLLLDLLNVWHLTLERQPVETEEIIERWLRPKHLGHACYFGRVDVVESAINTGLPLDGADFGGNPIAAAFEAFVTTPLHLRCVELLFRAGAKATLEQFNAHSVESTGSSVDVAMRLVLVEHAKRSKDPAVRARAIAWSS